MNKQLILDIETLSQKGSAVMINASFLVYDVVNDSSVPLIDLAPRVKTFKLDVMEQIDAGRHKSESTATWWKEQLAISPHLRKMLAKSPEDLKMRDFYSSLTVWLKANGYNKRANWAWQRGTLDIMVLDDMWDMLNYAQNDYPILWWKVRQLRTAIDLMGMGTTGMDGYITNIKEDVKRVIPNFTKHNPAHDILLEIEQLRRIGLFS